MVFRPLARLRALVHADEGLSADVRTPSGPAIPWLIRLRWLALLVLLALPLGSSSGAPRGRGAVAFAALILAMAATNLALSRATRSTRDLRRELVGTVLVLDTGLLTGMLLLSGGAVNPGTVVYLVHITFAAVLLGARWAWVLTVLSWRTPTSRSSRRRLPGRDWGWGCSSRGR